ncbi:LAFA_0F19702g1_1 [Lachancea sp. 'fantastica']|nr:LAFA_0F19702g1_1 [Lachancea sp. 'fantastica']
MEQTTTYVSTWLARTRQSWEDRGLPRIDALSFVLGAVAALMLSFLEPVLKALIGGILVSLLTLLKYAICTGGVIACWIILKSKKGLNSESPVKPIGVGSTHQDDARNKFVQRAVENADDYEIVDYKDVKRHRSPATQPIHVESPYERFVNQAR